VSQKRKNWLYITFAVATLGLFAALSMGFFTIRTSTTSANDVDQQIFVTSHFDSQVVILWKVEDGKLIEAHRQHVVR